MPFQPYCIAYAIASVCVPVCTHFEALYFHPSSSYETVAEALSWWYKPISYFHVICIAYAIASVCVPVCTNFEALHFRHRLLKAAWLLLSPVRISPFRILYAIFAKLQCICHRLGLRARVHAFRGTSFSSTGLLCECG